MIGAKPKRETATAVRSKIRQRILLAAVLVAGAVFLLMVTGTRFVMNGWSKTEIEKLMSQGFTRTVHMGKTSWALGLSGLILSTDSFVIDERNGGVFLSSGPAEFGLALLPMARGEFYANHMRFTDPRIKAIRLDGKRWNFSDLPQVPAMKYIQWIQITGGHVDALDKSAHPAPWSGRTLENIVLRVQKPGEHSVWPFSITADAPGQGYITKVSLTGIGTGALDDWAKNNHTFEAEINALNSEDVRLFADAAPKMSGFIDAKLKGQGVPEKGFHANADITTKALRVPIPTIGDWKIIDGTSSADFIVDENKLQWKNFSLSLPDVVVRSEGALDKWRTAQPSYQTSVDFVAADVNSIAKMLPARALPRDMLSATTLKRLTTDLELTASEAMLPTRLGGPAIIKATFVGQGANVSADMTIRGDRISMTTKLADNHVVQALGHVDMRTRLVTHPAFDGQDSEGGMLSVANVDNAIVTIDGGAPVAQKIKGKVTVADTTFTLAPLTGKFGSGDFKLTGTVSQNAHAPVNLQYTGDNVDILQVKRVLTALGLQSLLANDHNIAGVLASANVTIKGTANAPIVSMTATPRDIYFKSGELENALRISSGTVSYKGGVFSLSDVGGRLGRGTLKLNGSTSVKGNDLHLVGTNLDMSMVQLAVRGLDIRPVSLQPQVLYGLLDSVNLQVSGPTSKPIINLTAQPNHLYYAPKGMQRTFVVTGGKFSLKNNVADLSHITGSLGRGTFTLNGSAKLAQTPSADLSFSAKNLDMSNVKLALQALGVKHPLLAQQLLYGTATDIKMTLKGTLKAPLITMAAVPENIQFEPFGSSRTLRMLGGHVSYANDILTLDKVRVKTQRSDLTASLRLANLSKGSKFEVLDLDTPQFDFGDLHSYLTAERTPPAVRDAYVKLIAQNGLSVPHGKMSGKFRIDQTEGHREVKGQFELKNFGITFYNYPVRHVHGKVWAQGDDLLVEQVKGTIGKSPFNLTGRIENAAFPEKVDWKGSLNLQVHVNDFLALISTADAKMTDIMTASHPIPVHMEFSGSPQMTAASFKSDIEADTVLSVGGPFGISKPAGQKVSLEGKLKFGAQDGPPRIQITESKMAIGDTMIGWQGEYLISDKTVPQVHFSFEIPDPIPVSQLVTLLPQDNRLKDIFKGATGKAKGALEFQGPASGPAMKGFVEVVDAGLPQLKLANVTGSIRATDWFPPAKVTVNEKRQMPDGRSELLIDMVTLRASDAVFSKVKGRLLAEDTPNGTKISLREMNTELFGGTAAFEGWIVLSAQRPFNLLTKFSNLNADALVTALLKKPGQFTGTVEGRTHLEGRAVEGPDFLKELKGIGTFTAHNGRVARLKELQTKLTQGNFLMQGVLGFNINNLLATLAPVKSGSYETFSGKFRMRSKKITFAKLIFNGDELRLRGEGEIDMNANTLNATIAGNIPRIAKSFLPKPVARAASWLSAGTWLNQLAARTSIDFPNIPLIGGGGDLKPRSFEFTIKTDVRRPDTIAAAISQSFHFLPPQQAATAYPPLGLNASSQDERWFEPSPLNSTREASHATAP